jgi:hypothetical protein
LKAGDEMDLGAGHDFRADIREACAKMEAASKSFDDRRVSLTRFAVMVAGLPKDEGNAA